MIEIEHAGLGAAYLRSHPDVPIAHVLGAACGFCEPIEEQSAATPAPAVEPDGLRDEDVARLFHEAYERLAPSFGYETRKASAVPWESVPEPNRSLMVAVAGEVRAALAATPPETGLDVGVLVQAYANVEGAGEWTAKGRIPPSWVPHRVAAIAAEYARLADKPKGA